MSEFVTFTEDQRDCLQEIVNVAMGEAGDSLARFLETFVNLSVPQISLVKSSDLNKELVRLVGMKETVSGVRQGFHTTDTAKGLKGEAIVIFSDASFMVLADLLSYENTEVDDQVERELLLDITNILNGTCLTGIGAQIETELMFSPPTILGQHLAVGNLLDKDAMKWDQALLVEINYTLEDRSLKCSLLMLMPGDSIRAVRAELDKILEEL